MKMPFMHLCLSALSMVLIGAMSMTFFSGCASKPVIIQDDDEQLYSRTAGSVAVTTAGNSDIEDPTGDVPSEDTQTPVDTPTQPNGKPVTGSKATTTRADSKTTAPVAGVKRTVAQIKKLNNVPRLYINGKLSTGNLLFINGDLGGDKIVQAYQRQVSYASENGVNLFSTIYNINYAYKDTTSKDLVFNGLKGKLSTITEMDENAQILVRLSVIGGKAQFGDSEMGVYGGVQSGRVSIASDKWIEQTVKRVKDLVTYIRNDKEYADNVYGYHLDCGEWFSEGFITDPDTSETNTREFREWLTAKYKTDAALQAAWGQSTVKLTTASVPADQLKQSGLMLSKASTRYVDYYDYWNEMTASRVEAIAKGIKEASNNENIVLSFFGYYFEQYHPSTGHWDFRRLLESKYLDGFASPTTYMDRNGGSNPNVATSGFMSTVDSVTRAGKIWVMESDERTFLNTTNQSGDMGIWTALKSIEDIQEVHKREMGIAMIHATTMYPMDLSGRGWYDDEDIWKNFGKVNKAYAAYSSAMKKQPTFEVALVVDEDAGRLLNSNPELPRAMLDIYRAGISFSLIELDDILLGRADDYKTYIFLNPYRLSSSDVTTLVSKLHKNNKTAIYLNGFGNASAADVQKLTGMSISSSDYSSSSPKTFSGSGYKSVFIGTNGTGTPDKIRTLAKYGNAHVFIETKDVLVANENMVMLHASSTGNKTVKFSGTVDVYDYFENKWYTGVSSVTLNNMRSATCRWLFYGKKADIQAMKLPAWSK